MKQQPSAPPVVEPIYPSLQAEGSNFRLFEICKLEGGLESERDVRAKLYKKYRRAIDVVETTLVGCRLGCSKLDSISDLVSKAARD